MPFKSREVAGFPLKIVYDLGRSAEGIRGDLTPLGGQGRVSSPRTLPRSHGFWLEGPQIMTALELVVLKTSHKACSMPPIGFISEPTSKLRSVQVPGHIQERRLYKEIRIKRRGQMPKKPHTVSPSP